MDSLLNAIKNIFKSDANGKLIRYVTPNLRLKEKVIIVGSSGTILNKNHGKIIDDADEVIRFNRAPVEGFENGVGSKTTLRVANNHVFDNIDILEEGYSHQPKDFIKNLKDQRILYIGPDLDPWENRHSNTHSSCELFLFNYNKINDFKRRLNALSIPKQMTIGGVVVGLCVLAGIKPIMVGFDFEPTIRTHYWELRPSSPSGAHSVTEEQKWCLSLEKQNKIAILR